MRTHVIETAETDRAAPEAAEPCLLDVFAGLAQTDSVEQAHQVMADFAAGIPGVEAAVVYAKRPGAESLSLETSRGLRGAERAAVGVWDGATAKAASVPVLCEGGAQACWRVRMLYCAADDARFPLSPLALSRGWTGGGLVLVECGGALCMVAAVASRAEGGLPARCKGVLCAFARRAGGIFARLHRHAPGQGRCGQALERANQEQEERTAGTTREARKAAQFLQQLIDAVPAPLFCKDEQGRYTVCNAEFERFTGVGRSELLGRTVHDLWPTDLAGKYEAADRELMQRGGVQTYESQVEYAGGTRHDVVFHKAAYRGGSKGFTGLVGVILDITDRKRVEAEMSRLSAAVEQAGEGFAITDPAGFIQYTNPAFERITGHDRRRIAGCNIGILKSNEQTPSFYNTMRRTVRGGGIWEGELTCLRADGGEFEACVTASPVYDGLGHIANYVLGIHDRTREAALEEQLRQAQKMQAIGTLAGGIAHDFNNMLYAIMGFAELALDETAQDGPAHQCIEQILDAGKRATALVNQILTFSRQDRAQTELLDLSEMMRQNLDFLRHTSPSSIEIREEIAEGPLVVRADPAKVDQLVMNLCTNALHAMPEGGVLSVVLTHVSQADNPLPAAASPAGEAGDCARLEIVDTGHGMEPQVLDRIFEPYFTTKEVGKGTGMGLATVHGIVEEMGGAIAVSSKPDQGARFEVYLPLCEGPPAEAQVSGKSAPLRGTERVLFVDDEGSIVRMARLALSGLGYRVEAFTSSAAALEAFRAEPGRFDVVITDLTMPEYTGLQLAEALRVIRSDIPIVLCTGFSEIADKDRLGRLCIDGCLRKPVIKRDLAGAVRQVLDGGGTLYGAHSCGG